VTQANIGSSICLAGWTAPVRPPESYTERLKVQQMAAYGDLGPVSAYEEDHLIPLELGGSPASPSNLWPEIGALRNPKDSVENAARRAVCKGSLGLAAAQLAMSANWIVFGEQLGVTSVPTPASPSPAAPPVTAPPTTLTPVSNYRAGEFCARSKEAQVVQTSEGPLICKVTTDPSHPRWEHT
jgi:hypothetical protein